MWRDWKCDPGPRQIEHQFNFRSVAIFGYDLGKRFTAGFNFRRRPPGPQFSSVPVGKARANEVLGTFFQGLRGGYDSTHFGAALRNHVRLSFVPRSL